MTARNHSRRKSTAYHEAGHAVIGRVLTLACGKATIRPNYKTLEAGHTITEDQWACITEWEKRGKVRDSFNAVWVARILAVMAGAEAQSELLGVSSVGVGDGDDRVQIGLMMEELVGTDVADEVWRRKEARLRAMTRMLVRRHRARIERVAKELLAKTTLNAEELDALVGRSVNDVKVNAPLLLQKAHSRPVGGAT